MLIKQQEILLSKCKGVRLDEENKKNIINWDNGCSNVSRTNIGSRKE